MADVDFNVSSGIAINKVCKRWFQLSVLGLIDLKLTAEGSERGGEMKREMPGKNGGRLPPSALVEETL